MSCCLSGRGALSCSTTTNWCYPRFGRFAPAVRADGRSRNTSMRRASSLRASAMRTSVPWTGPRTPCDGWAGVMASWLASEGRPVDESFKLPSFLRGRRLLPGKRADAPLPGCVILVEEVDTTWSSGAAFNGVERFPGVLYDIDVGTVLVQRPGDPLGGKDLAGRGLHRFSGSRRQSHGVHGPRRRAPAVTQPACSKRRLVASPRRRLCRPPAACSQELKAQQT